MAGEANIAGFAQCIPVAVTFYLGSHCKPTVEDHEVLPQLNHVMVFNQLNSEDRITLHADLYFLFFSLILPGVCYRFFLADLPRDEVILSHSERSRLR